MGVSPFFTKWIEKKLGLKVNATKTKVTKPSYLKYLGFGFVKMGEKWEARPHQDSIVKFKRKLKKLVNQHRPTFPKTQPSHQRMDKLF